MNHIDQDNFIKLALQILEPEEEKRLTSHLNECRQCWSKMKEIQKEVSDLAGIGFDLENKSYPLPALRRSNIGTVWKIAAALALGFLSGYLTSRLTQPYYIDIVPQKLNKNFAQFQSFQPVNCAGIDIGH
jgi:hypothetical protein